MDYEEYNGEYNEEYIYDEEEGALMAEVDVLNRVEFENGDTLEKIAMDAGVIPEVRKKGERFSNIKWRFYVYVNATIRRLINDRIITNVHTKEIPFILRQIALIENPEYKNPEAFVCGYAVSKNKVVDKKILDFIVSASGGTVKSTDIIRYARLWIQLY